MAAPPRRWMPLVIVAGIALYVMVHVYATHSEAFGFVSQIVRKSAAIQSRVGNVQQVRLGILDSYREKFAGSDKWVKMTVGVVGDKGTIKVRTSVKKAGGTWSVTDASIDGEPVNLN